MTIPIGRQPPTDSRPFIHKKLLGGISKLAGVLPIPGGQLISRVTGAFAGGGTVPRVRPVSRATVSRTQTARVSRFSENEKRQGQFLKFGGGGAAPLSVGPGAPCFPGWVRNRNTGECEFFGTGGNGGGNGTGGGQIIPVTPLGDPVMGRYGAGVVPGSLIIDRAVCGKGMQLGDDGICYNKSQISNKQRMWPRGRRPLLTGGEMRAIGIASRSGKRLDNTATKLRAMGMMKALPKGRSKKCPPGRAPGAGTTIVQN